MRSSSSIAVLVMVGACGLPAAPTGDAGVGTDGGIEESDGGRDAGAGAPDAGGGAEALPTTREAIVAFAQRRAYTDWPAEPAAHLSTGPHGGRVRTWVNPVLAASLKAGSTNHPPGSIAVKELYGSGTSITGWAVDVKDLDGTWIFFEGFTPALNQYFFRGTANLCGNCHRAGLDQVLTPPSALP